MNYCITTVGGELNESFSTIRDKLNIKNQFVLNWLDMLCFLLQGKSYSMPSYL